MKCDKQKTFSVGGKRSESIRVNTPSSSSSSPESTTPLVPQDELASTFHNILQSSDAFNNVIKDSSYTFDSATQPDLDYWSKPSSNDTTSAINSEALSLFSEVRKNNSPSSINNAILRELSLQTFGDKNTQRVKSGVMPANIDVVSLFGVKSSSIQAKTSVNASLLTAFMESMPPELVTLNKDTMSNTQAQTIVLNTSHSIFKDIHDDLSKTANAVLNGAPLSSPMKQMESSRVSYTRKIVSLSSGDKIEKVDQPTEAITGPNLIRNQRFSLSDKMSNEQIQQFAKDAIDKEDIDNTYKDLLFPNEGDKEDFMKTPEFHKQLSRTLDSIRDNGNAFYFNTRLDPRGRVNYDGWLVTPQGASWQKAMLELITPRPDKGVLNNRGRFWTAMELSENYGEDKMSFQERQAWVENNWNNFLDPEHELYFRNHEKKPMIFRALSALNDGHTRIISNVDSTSSGFQITAALLSDSVLGKYTNLNSKSRSDLYSFILSTAEGSISPKTITKLKELGLWGRSLFKKPSMMYIYGSKETGRIKKIQVDIAIEMAKAQGIKKGDRTKIRLIRSESEKLAVEVHKAFEAVIKKELSAVTDIKTRLIEAIRANPQPFHRYTLPDGFEATSYNRVDSQDNITIRQSSKGGDKDTKVTVDNTYNPAKEGEHSERKILANVVQAFDGYIVRELTKRAWVQDHVKVVSNHDSFGTHPNDMDVILKHYKNIMIEMNENDYLRGVIKEISGGKIDKPTKRTESPLKRENIIISPYMVS